MAERKGKLWLVEQAPDRIKLGRATVHVHRTARPLFDRIYPALRELRVEAPGDDEFSDLAAQIVHHLISASQILDERHHIVYADEQYESLLIRGVMPELFYEISAHLQNPHFGAPLRSPRLSPEAVVPLAAAQVIDRSIKLLDAMASSVEGGSLSLKNAARAMRHYGAIQALTLFLKQPEVVRAARSSVGIAGADAAHAKLNKLKPTVKAAWRDNIAAIDPLSKAAFGRAWAETIKREHDLIVLGTTIARDWLKNM